MVGVFVKVALQEPEPWRARLLSAAAELELMPGESPELWRSLGQLERDDARTVLEQHAARLVPSEREELGRCMVRLFDLRTRDYTRALLEFVIWSARSDRWEVQTEARCLGVLSGVLYEPDFYAKAFGVQRLRVMLGRMRKRGLELSLYRYLENALRRATL